MGRGCSKHLRRLGIVDTLRARARMGIIATVINPPCHACDICCRPEHIRMQLGQPCPRDGRRMEESNESNL
jgi:hypothetical protein